MEEEYTPDNPPGAEFERPEFWNERYASDADFGYGLEANNLVKTTLARLPPGRILLVAAGSGRNAVFAAQLGWRVDAIDFSSTARDKALLLAEQQGVTINYAVADATRFTPQEQYDVITFIYFHLGPAQRSYVMRSYLPYLKPGGRVIATFFSPQQLGKTSGGPRHPDWLINGEEVMEIFEDLSIEQLEENDEILKEGSRHQGLASTVRFVGKKKKLKKIK